MAKITSDYIRRAYLREFYELTRDQQSAQIMALETIRDCKPQPQAELFSDAEMSAGEIEARELISEQSQAMEAAR